MKYIIFREKQLFVDEQGNLYNKDKRKYSQHKNSSGYMCITDANKCYLTHRIVAMAYIENPKNKDCVNHKDGNRCNNCVENLEWVTKSENAIHSIRVLGNKINVKGLKPNWANPIQSKKLIMDGVVYKSGVELSKYLGVTPAAVNNHLKGKSKTVKGKNVEYYIDEVKSH